MLYSTPLLASVAKSHRNGVMLLIAGILLLLVTPTFAAMYSQHYGVVDQWGYETPELGQGSMDVVLQNLGAKWIRSGWDWDLIEGLGDDQYDPGYLALMDNWVVGMNAVGANIYYGFSYTPAWARPGGTGNNTPPTNPAKYTEFITFMVNRYKNSIKYWGLWNEPNIDGFWNGTDDNYIHNILIPGIAAIKAADPTAHVVVGELASCCNEQTLLQTFLNEINAHGEKSLVDVISVHGYGYGDTASGRISHLDTLHNMIVSAGWGDKDFWCTETSWDGNGTTGEANQAAQITAFMQGMDTRPWWTKTFYFTMGQGPGAYQGLIRSDLSLKPAYTQLQQLIADRADNANIVSNTIPATMVAGRQYYVSISVKNEGTVTWNDPNQWRLGAIGDSDPFAGGRQQFGPGESVAPDSIKQFWFSMTAPATTGTYTTDWQMVHEGVHWFGHPLTKTVTVNSGPDTTAPGPPTPFVASRGDQSVTLSWTNPTDADCAGIVIRRKTTGYPTSISDGTTVITRPELAGQPATYTDTGLTNDVTYYYSIFARDVVPNYSAAANANATPTDLTPPNPVTALAATAAQQQVTLSWQNPADSDFAGTMIRFKMNGYPTSSVDGNLVCDKNNTPGSGDSFVHTGLTTGATFYYGAFSRDAGGNYRTTPVTVSGTTDSQTLWLTEPFDSRTDGNLGGQGNWTTAAADSQVQSTFASSGKAVELDAVAAAGTITNSYAGFAKKTSGTQIVYFDAAEAWTGTTPTAAHGAVVFYADDATEIARFTAVANQWKLEYGTGNVTVLTSTVTQNTYYNIKLIFDLGQRKISAYVNGVSKASNLSFKTGSASNLAKIALTCSPVSGLTTQQFYVDGLRGETAPAAPASVTDDGAYTGSLSKLHCSWTSGGASTVEYRYAIGTTPGGTNVVNWTDAGPATEVTRDSLTLNAGSTYYFAIQGGNGYGSWTSPSVNSNGIKIPTAGVSIQAAKALADGSLAADNRAVRGKLVSAAFPGYFYIQEPETAFGLKVLSSAAVSPGDLVDVAGLMKGSNAERYLDASANALTTVSPNPWTGASPVVLTSAALGGATLNTRTPGVVGSYGPNNIGLLVTACGKVTQRKLTDPKYFYIDDGCALLDGTTTDGTENVGVRIIADPASYPVGSYVKVTGISSLFSDAGLLKKQVLPTSIQALSP